MEYVIKRDCRDVFTNEEYVNAYRNSRWIPDPIFDKYVRIIRDELGDRLHAGISVLDLGCGTGQFAIKLSNIHELNIKTIDAIDSSDKKISLLNCYLKENSISNVTTYTTDFFAYNTDKLYDIIICSEVIHLIDDVLMLFSRVYDRLKDNGVFIIRTSTHEQLYTREWYKPFPKCRFIDIARHKSKYLILSCASLTGYRHIEIREVNESRTEDKAAYLDRIRNKCFSTLHLISQAEFEHGLSALDMMYTTQTEILYDYIMSCYILRK